MGLRVHAVLIVAGDVARYRGRYPDSRVVGIFGRSLWAFPEFIQLCALKEQGQYHPRERMDPDISRPARDPFAYANGTDSAHHR